MEETTPKELIERHTITPSKIPISERIEYTVTNGKGYRPLIPIEYPQASYQDLQIHLRAMEIQEETGRMLSTPLETPPLSNLQKRYQRLVATRIAIEELSDPHKRGTLVFSSKRRIWHHTSCPN